jgi:hypothetical protein
MMEPTPDILNFNTGTVIFSDGASCYAHLFFDEDGDALPDQTGAVVWIAQCPSNGKFYTIDCRSFERVAMN